MSWKPILLIDLLLNNFFLTVHGVCWKIDVITLALFLSSMMRPAGMWMRHFYLNFTSQNIWIGLIFSSLKWPSNGVVKRLNTAALTKLIKGLAYIKTLLKKFIAKRRISANSLCPLLDKGSYEISLRLKQNENLKQMHENR